jgi:hypothetical protein
MLGGWPVAGDTQVLSDLPLCGWVTVVVQVGGYKLQNLLLTFRGLVSPFLFYGIHITTIHNNEKVCQEVDISVAIIFV